MADMNWADFEVEDNPYENDGEEEKKVVGKATTSTTSTSSNSSSSSSSSTKSKKKNKKDKKKKTTKSELSTLSGSTAPISETESVKSGMILPKRSTFRKESVVPITTTSTITTTSSSSSSTSTSTSNSTPIIPDLNVQPNNITPTPSNIPVENRQVIFTNIGEQADQDVFEAQLIVLFNIFGVTDTIEFDRIKHTSTVVYGHPMSAGKACNAFDNPTNLEESVNLVEVQHRIKINLRQVWYIKATMKGRMGGGASAAPPTSFSHAPSSRNHSHKPSKPIQHPRPLVFNPHISPRGVQRPQGQSRSQQQQQDR